MTTFLMIVVLLVMLFWLAVGVFDLARVFV